MSPERIDPGRTDFTVQDDAEDRRRPHAGLHRARGRALLEGDRHARARLGARDGRAREAAREHLPLGQHRAHERDGDALRPHGHRRLGGRRRGRHQAVRLHALHARPRPRRALHPARPVLPLVARAAVRLPHRVHRARRQGQPEHAVLLPREGRAGAQRPGQAAARLARARRRRGLQARHRRHARVAGAQGHRAAARGGLRTSATTTRSCRSCRELELELGARSTPRSTASDCVVVVTDHSAIDYADLVERAKLVVDFRNATGSAGTRNGKVVKL